MDIPTTHLERILRTLAVGTRLRLVELLRGRALCVGALAARLDVTQGAVSQHLRILRDAGLVLAERRGTFIHYRLNERAMARWRAAIDAFLGPAAARTPRKAKGDGTWPRKKPRAGNRRT